MIGCPIGVACVPFLGTVPLSFPEQETLAVTRRINCQPCAEATRVRKHFETGAPRTVPRFQSRPARSRQPVQTDSLDEPVHFLSLLTSCGMLPPGSPAQASGRKHECARVNVKRVWAPTQELVFGRYPLRRGWTLVREVRRLYWVGSDWKYVEAKQVSGETRSDPDWHTQ